MSARQWLRAPHVLASDPLGQHQAARLFGKIVAMGLLELEDVLPPLVNAALEAGWQGDVMGLRVRLAWTVTDAAAAWEITRDKAQWAVRRAIRPLFEAWADPAVIRRAAFRENAAWGDPLLTYEVVDMVQAEAARMLWRRRRHA